MDIRQLFRHYRMWFKCYIIYRLQLQSMPYTSQRNYWCASLVQTNCYSYLYCFCYCYLTNSHNDWQNKKMETMLDRITHSCIPCAFPITANPMSVRYCGTKWRGNALAEIKNKANGVDSIRTNSDSFLFADKHNAEITLPAVAAGFCIYNSLIGSWKGS